ncbi:MAG: TetR/AcrR family transcriptional regulator [Deltaproteobacteria bacterium]|nr:TetR/AcrR family transcriptional regulator [Deltaproteobacteria bacterium]
MNATNDTKPKRGRPARISPEQILAVAKTISSKELTMSLVADKLGVKTPALYHHFKSREDLLLALGRQIAQTFPLRAPDPGNWRAWILATATDLLDFMLANPVLQDVREWGRLQPISVPLMENLLETLEEAGFSTEQAYRIWNVVFTLAIADARILTVARDPKFAEEQEAAAAQYDESLMETAPRTVAMVNLIKGQPPEKMVRENLRWLVDNLPEPSQSK